MNGNRMESEWTREEVEALLCLGYAFTDEGMRPLSYVEYRKLAGYLGRRPTLPLIKKECLPKVGPGQWRLRALSLPRLKALVEREEEMREVAGRLEGFLTWVDDEFYPPLLQNRKDRDVPLFLAYQGPDELALLKGFLILEDAFGEVLALYETTYPERIDQSWRDEAFEAGGVSFLPDSVDMANAGMSEGPVSRAPSRSGEDGSTGTSDGETSSPSAASGPVSESFADVYLGPESEDVSESGFAYGEDGVGIVLDPLDAAEELPASEDDVSSGGYSHIESIVRGRSLGAGSIVGRRRLLPALVESAVENAVDGSPPAASGSEETSKETSQESAAASSRQPGTPSAFGRDSGPGAEAVDPVGLARDGGGGRGRGSDDVGEAEESEQAEAAEAAEAANGVDASSSSSSPSPSEDMAGPGADVGADASTDDDVIVAAPPPFMANPLSPYNNPERQEEIIRKSIEADALVSGVLVNPAKQKEFVGKIVRAGHRAVMYAFAPRHLYMEDPDYRRWMARRSLTIIEAPETMVAFSSKVTRGTLRRLHLRAMHIAVANSLLTLVDAGAALEEDFVVALKGALQSSGDVIWLENGIEGQKRLHNSLRGFPHGFFDFGDVDLVRMRDNMSLREMNLVGRPPMFF